MFNELEAELKKIQDFVNIKFDINDIQALEAVKEGLSLEKVEKLEQMVKDYKKAYKMALNKQKRIEAQREAQKNYKKIGTNLKLKEYSIYEEEAKKLNVSISQFVKNALEAFKSSKSVKADNLPTEIDLKPYKQDIERLNAESLKLKTELLEKQKLIDKFIIENENKQKKIVRLNTEKTSIEEQQTKQIEKLQEELKKLTNRGLFARIFNL